MKIDRVELDNKEATWLVRNVTRTLVMLEAAALKDPKVRERQTYKTLKAIEDNVVAIDLKEETANVVMPRKQKKVVKDMLQLTLLNIQDRIIPEYTRRGTEYKSYLDDATSKAEILRGMLRKFR